MHWNCLFRSRVRSLWLAAAILAVAGTSHGQDATRQDYREGHRAELKILDKITARVTPVTMMVGEELRHGRLTITLHRCATTPPEFTPESVAFVDLAENLGNQSGDNTRTLFSGWIFASSPGVSALEHPVYDVWLIACDLFAPDTNRLPDENLAEDSFE